MKFDLFDPSDFQLYVNRIQSLTPNHKALWGKMNVSQMMAHVSESLKSASGESKLKRVFVGYLFGKLAKKSIHNNEDFKKNLPTDTTFKISNQREFELEKEQLLNRLNAFHQGGKNKITNHPHPFFGKLSPDEWNRLMAKHLDHHLRQFGV